MTPSTSAAVVAATLVIMTVGACRLAVGSTRRTAALQRVESTLHPKARNHAGMPSAWTIPRPTAPSWFPGALSDAGCDLPPETVWSVSVAVLALAVVVAAVAGGPPLAAVAGTALVIGSFAVLHTSRGRGPARVEAALPNCLEAVARALRSGASLRQAVGEVAAITPGALGQELGRVCDEAGHGVPLVAALEGLAVRRPLPGVRLAVAALCLGAETGGAQAQAVDGVATTIRDRQAVAAEARALAAQARMSALVIGLAPIGFGVFAGSTDPRTAQFLLHTSAGLVLLVVGLTLDGLGWLWMQRLCRAPA